MSSFPSPTLLLSFVSLTPITTWTACTRSSSRQKAASRCFTITGDIHSWGSSQEKDSNLRWRSRAYRKQTNGWDSGSKLVPPLLGLSYRFNYFYNLVQHIMIEHDSLTSNHNAWLPQRVILVQRVFSFVLNVSQTK